ncbi:Integrase core domain [Popillia japonica]|uniref:RNA-directed DNA polymerase n=1 Tax=Popillia japonica TaxID=7064 RepID=A0AAW1K1A6_POPJA
MQSYDYEIEHRSNKYMQHVDALSRCFNTVLVIEENSLEENLTIKQAEDPIIAELKRKLEHEENKLYELRNGLIYRKDGEGLLFYVPKAMEFNLLRASHDDMSHVGCDKTIEVIRRSYWFPNMRDKVKNYISSCLKCITYNPTTDHCGPIEKTKHNNKYIFAVIDGCTKFIKLFACKTTNTSEVLKHLAKYFRFYGKPIRVISDRGAAFTSTSFKGYMTDQDIEHTLIAVGVPRVNGQIERLNRDIIPLLAKVTPSPERWDEILENVEFTLNNTVHRATKETPAKLLFGINQRGFIEDEMKLFLERDDTERDLEEYNKKYYDGKRTTPRKYTTGDLVMIMNRDVTSNINKKLIPKFKGPYKVKKALPNDRYIITDADGYQYSPKPFESVFAVDCIRPWCNDEEK